MKLQVCYEVPNRVWWLPSHKNCVFIDTTSTLTMPELEKIVRNQYNIRAKITSVKEIV